MQAVADDRSADAAAPLHRRKLALRARARLKVLVRGEVASAIVRERRSGPGVRSSFRRRANGAAALAALRDVVDGARDLELADGFHRERERAGAELAGAKHVSRLRAVDANVGRRPSLAEERRLHAGGRRQRAQIGKVAIDRGHAAQLLGAHAIVRAHARRAMLALATQNDRRRQLRGRAVEDDVDKHAAPERQFVAGPCLGSKSDVPNGDGVRSAEWKLEKRESTGRVVATDHSTPVLAFFAVTDALGTASPALSRTLPRMDASTVCARAGSAMKKSRKRLCRSFMRDGVRVNCHPDGCEANRRTCF